MTDILRGRLDTSVPALVLKLGRYRLHHGPLGVVRSLGRVGVPVYAVQEDRWTSSAVSRYLTGGVIWPVAERRAAEEQAQAEAFLSGLTHILEHVGRPTVVIPTDDDAAVALDAARDRLPGNCLVPASSPGLAAAVVDKETCSRLARQVGVPVPERLQLRCPLPSADLNHVPLPCILKRSRRDLLPDGTRTFSTVIATRREHLREALQDEQHGNYDVLVQELLPGEDWLYHGYLAPGPEVVVGFTGRKLRSRPAYAGETCFARVVDDEEVRAVSEQLLKGLGYVGPVSLDLRRDRRDGAVKVLDVNPRVGACFRLFTTVEGVDVIRAMHLNLTGRDVPRSAPVPGRSYLVENYDLEVRGAYGRSGRMDDPREAAGVDERAWFVADDLLPAIGMELQGWLGEPRGGPHDAGSRPAFFRGRDSRRRSGDAAGCPGPLPPARA
jgi:D-aspartate ligase